LKLTTERKSLIKQQILMYKTAVYTLVNGAITHQKTANIKNVILLSSTLTLAECSPRKTSKTRGIYTSESSFVACFGVIPGTGIFGNFGTGREGGIFKFMNRNSRWPCLACTY